MKTMISGVRLVARKIAESAILLLCISLLAGAIVAGLVLQPKSAEATGSLGGCSGCHGNGPVDGATRDAATGQFPGSHNVHTSTYSLNCEICHSTPNYAWFSHQGDTIQVNLRWVSMAGGVVQSGSVAGWGSYSRGTSFTNWSTMPGTNFGTCQNTYCHSKGLGGTLNTNDPRAIIPSTSPIWGTVTPNCSPCHGNETGNPGTGAPWYTSATLTGNWVTAKANSHQLHAPGASGAGVCNRCHNATTNTGNTITSVGNHIKRTYTLAAGSGISFTHAYGTNGSTCTNASCHSSNLAANKVMKWGTYSGGGPAAVSQCVKCHGVAGQTPAQFTTDNGVAAPGFNAVGVNTWNTLGTITNNVSNASKVWAHDSHLRSPSVKGYTTVRGVECSDCHDIEAIKTNIYATNHMNGTTNFVWSSLVRNVGNNNPKWNTLALAPWYSSGNQKCGNIYCHGQSATDAGVQGNGWASLNFNNNAWLTVSSAKSAGSCNKCHLAPPTRTTGYDHPGNSVTLATDCIPCHGHNGSGAGHIDGTLYGAGSCIDCHATEKGGVRAAVVAQFNANSHHVQGVVLDNIHCYRCHWEANSAGAQTGYHTGAAGGVVDLVVWGSTVRPLTYTTATGTATAVQFWSSAASNRTESAKLNTHCLGCHSDVNKNTDIFGDGKRPAIYAWDSTSIAARYSQSGWATWGKYFGMNVSPKNQIKAFSAHGWASTNQRGWSTMETWPDTSSSVGVLCADCHNSHGSWVTGGTSYASWQTLSGGILIDGTKGLGGAQATYRPVARGWNTHWSPRVGAGAALCFDCHQNESANWISVNGRPWGWGSTFQASKDIIGYDDSTDWTTGMAGTRGRNQRSPYKKQGSIMGSHFDASSNLGYTPSISIGGLCTKCHDPHGVSPVGVGYCSNGVDTIWASCTGAGGTWTAAQQYGLPLLKGTYITSPYKEDAAPKQTLVSKGGGSNAKGWASASHAGYQIDQNTFRTPLRGTAMNAWSSSRSASGANQQSWVSNTMSLSSGQWSSITQTANVFGGLCLQCHPKNQIWAVTGTNNNPSWATTTRIHHAVRGWASGRGWGTNNNNEIHGYTCSKCHTPHSSGLPRLMITNCLDWKHRGQVASGGPNPVGKYTVQSAGGSGRFPKGGGGFVRSSRAWLASGAGGGIELGTWASTPIAINSRVGCHEARWTSINDQRWNLKTQW